MHGKAKRGEAEAKSVVTKGEGCKIGGPAALGGWGHSLCIVKMKLKIIQNALSVISFEWTSPPPLFAAFEYFLGIVASFARSVWVWVWVRFGLVLIMSKRKSRQTCGPCPHGCVCVSALRKAAWETFWGRPQQSGNSELFSRVRNAVVWKGTPKIYSDSLVLRGKYI